MTHPAARPLPTVAEQTQAEWMALESGATEADKKRVFKLMEQQPRIYVSGHDGKGVCIYDAMPLSPTLPFEQALTQCRGYSAKDGCRTDVAWNGTLGVWYSLT